MCVLWLIYCRSLCGSVDLNVGVTRKIKNAIERAAQGSFYFILFPQFYMYQTNKLRKEKSKNRLKYNYGMEKDENSIFRENRCTEQ